LTKAQTSPTSPLGFHTNTHPDGAILAPHNPLAITLGIANVSFVAQVVDWNPPLLQETLRAAHDHKGTGFVRIIQRCPVYAKPIVDQWQSDPSQFALLTHPNGIPVDKSVARLFPNQREHDPSDLAAARALVSDPKLLPVGLLYRNPDAPRYEELSSRGADMSPEAKLAAINAALDRFTI
jgi:2-oxoglutarate ferredoxin oxidoreductase subunit beta